jgi:integrase
MIFVRKDLRSQTTWLEFHNLPTANLTPRLADDFIRDMRAMSGRDADSTRLVVSACASFFTFLERRLDEIRNSFRGSRARPASTWTEAVIPNARELEVLQTAAEPALAAALSVAIETGLRVGGLPGLTMLEDGTWHTVSKAHRLQASEPLSAEVLRTFKAARLESPPTVCARELPAGSLSGRGRDEGQRGATAHCLAENAARAALRGADARRENRSDL